MYKIGIDLGGTKTEGVLVDEEFQIIERKRVPTNQNNGYESILETIQNLVSDLKKNNEKTSIGVCTPGALSKESGLIKNSNTQCLIGKDIKNDLEKILDQEIFLLSQTFHPFLPILGSKLKLHRGNANGLRRP